MKTLLHLFPVFATLMCLMAGTAAHAQLRPPEKSGEHVEVPLIDPAQPAYSYDNRHHAPQRRKLHDAEAAPSFRSIFDKPVDQPFPMARERAANANEAAPRSNDTKDFTGGAFRRVPLAPERLHTEFEDAKAGKRSTSEERMWGMLSDFKRALFPEKKSGLINFFSPAFRSPVGNAAQLASAFEQTTTPMLAEFDGAQMTRVGEEIILSPVAFTDSNGDMSLILLGLAEADGQWRITRLDAPDTKKKAQDMPDVINFNGALEPVLVSQY